MTDEPNWLPKLTTLGTVTIGGRKFAARRNANGEVYYHRERGAQTRVITPEARATFFPSRDEYEALS